MSSLNNWWNKLTGQGSTGDHGGTGFVVPRPAKTPQEIGELLSHAALIRIACAAVAEDITRAWRTHSSQRARWVDLEEKFEIRDTVERALFFAEGFGGAFVIPKYPESLVTAEMLALSRPVIKQNLLGFEVYPQQLLKCHPLTQAAKQPNGAPMYYALAGRNNIKIHYTWLYGVKGPFAIPYFSYAEGSQTANNDTLLGQSRVDIIYDDFFRMVSADAALSHVLVKGNIDILKVKGLADAVARCDTTAEMNKALSEMLQKASSTVVGANSYQPIVIDAEESLERKGGNHSGATEIARELRSVFVAATRIPRTRLFGEQSKGLTDGGVSDLVSYYDTCGTVRERRATPLLNWLDGIIAPGVRTKWEYNSLWDQDLKEKAETDKLIAETDNLYASMGVKGILGGIAKRLSDEERYTLIEDVQSAPLD